MVYIFAAKEFMLRGMRHSA